MGQEADAAGRPRLVEGLRLERLVGHGGEGEVWQARDVRGRRRALKLVRPEALAAPDAVAERASYLQRIDHPALVRVHRSGRVEGGALDGWGFVEMDLVEGASLAAAPGDWGLLDRLLPLAEALDLLHAGHWSDGLALVHRDVKPANIIATPRGELVLVDPSTLRGVDSGAVTRIGTPVFAAPEVVTGRVGPPADVYSFAVTALALLTGARGAELAELVEHLHELDALDVPGGIHAGVDADPGARPVSCVELLTADEPTRWRDRAATSPRAPDGLADQSWLDGEGWLPGEDLDELASARRRVWPWLALLALVALGPPLGWRSGALQGTALAAAVGLAALLHLTAHALGRRALLLAVVAPPVAWALLLGDRLASGRRRPWAHALLTGAISGALAAPVAVALRVGAHDLATSLAAVAGVVVVLAAVAAVRMPGVAGLVCRLLLLPVWLAGAGVLLALGVLALPPAILTGHTRAAVRLITGTLVSAVEVVRVRDPA